MIDKVQNFNKEQRVKELFTNAEKSGKKNPEALKLDMLSTDVEVKALKDSVEVKQMPTFDSILLKYKNVLTPVQKTFITWLKNSFNTDIDNSKKNFNVLLKLMQGIEKNIGNKQIQKELWDIYYAKLNNDLMIFSKEWWLWISATVEEYMFKNTIKIDYATSKTIVIEKWELDMKEDGISWKEPFDAFVKKNWIIVNKPINKNFMDEKPYEYSYYWLLEFIKYAVDKWYSKKQLQKSLNFLIEYVNFDYSLETHTDKEELKYKIPLVDRYSGFVDYTPVWMEDFDNVILDFPHTKNAEERTSAFMIANGLEKIDLNILRKKLQDIREKAKQQGSTVPQESINYSIDVMVNMEMDSFKRTVLANPKEETKAYNDLLKFVVTSEMAFDFWRWDDLCVIFGENLNKLLKEFMDWQEKEIKEMKEKINKLKVKIKENEAKIKELDAKIKRLSESNETFKRLMGTNFSDGK